MDKVFKPEEFEEKIYRQWEEGGYFTPKIDRTKKPFTIILPLPNANDPMHMGHALFAIEDIMIRYHRMLGEPTLWLPGGDHAGIETQYVFEKHLAKKGQSRFDFDRETLYRMLWEFAEKNRGVNKDQMKRLGFSLDWSRYHYSLEPEIVARVLETFRKLHADGLIYRDERIVNYCTRCGTAFSDLEVDYVERTDPFYYLKYGPFTLATARPETKFRDTALAVNPKDKRYQKYLGQTLEIMGLLGPIKMTVIADPEVEIKFGTGIMKVTPAHDKHDFELGKKYNLPITPIIDLSGRMDFTWFLDQKNVDSKYLERAQKYHGKKINAARVLMVADLKADGLLVKTDENYQHRIGICYRCGTIIEPMVTPQWYLKTKPLAKPAIEAVRKGKTQVVPQKRFEKMYFDWMEKIEDWNISRQIVWGPRLPVWYCLDCNPRINLTLLSKDRLSRNQTGNYQTFIQTWTYGEIIKNLQSLIAPVNSSYQFHDGKCDECEGVHLIQETDTFDTWFLSGQWPVNTLKSKPGDFEYFYPTSVLDTLWDILFFWVGRMMMFGLYLTKKVPFEVVHIHARVVDKFGKKMSKSKGNVLDPLTMVEKYGADALRMALVIGVAPAGDIAISEEKIRAQRNFSNKIWNVARFVLSEFESFGGEVPFYQKGTKPKLKAEDKEILKKSEELVKSVTQDLNNYYFGRAAENICQFLWHEFADNYIESSKLKVQSSTVTKEEKAVTLSVLRHVLIVSLKLLHPFMPFVTEAIWQQIPYKKHTAPLIISKWPKV